jgi:hypothetical protein
MHKRARRFFGIVLCLGLISSSAQAYELELSEHSFVNMKMFFQPWMVISVEGEELIAKYVNSSLEK